MDFKQVEGQVITLMKELNREMHSCCGEDWALCNRCRWNKESSNGISICDNHTEIYPNTCVYEVIYEADYDTIEQIVRSLSDEISDDCNKYGEDCNKCKWGKELDNGINLGLMGNTICDASSFLYSEWSDIYDD